MARAFKWATRRVVTQAVASANQVCVDLLPALNFEEALKKGSTVTRIIAQVWSRPDTINQETELSFGIAIVNSDAAAANAFPDADIEGDNVAWFLRGMHVNRVSNLNDRSQWSYSSYDLRAQRVMRSAQEELHFIFDQSSGGGIELFLWTRVLMRLP